MKIQDDFIVFDNLVRVDPEVIGQTKELKAVKPKEFAASNAPGELANSSLEKAHIAGKESSARIKAMFA